MTILKLRTSSSFTAVLVITIFLGLYGNQPAYATPTEHAVPWANNGVKWHAMSPTERIAFINGMLYGIYAVAHQTSAAQDPLNLRLYHLSIGKMVNGIGECYADPRNLRMDIYTCLIWYEGKLRGESDEFLEQMLNPPPLPKHK